MDIKDLILSKEAAAIINDGTWVPIETSFGSIKLFTCGFKSDRVVRYIAAKKEEFAVAHGREPTDEEKSDLFTDVVLDVMIQDWDGVSDDGKPIPYDKELLRQIFKESREDAALELSKKLVEAINDIDKNARKYVDSTIKNSRPASGGKSKTRKQAS